MFKKVITVREGKYSMSPKVPEREPWIIVQKGKDKREKRSPWFSVEKSLAWQGCPSAPWA